MTDAGVPRAVCAFISSCGGCLCFHQHVSCQCMPAAGNQAIKHLFKEFWHDRQGAMAACCWHDVLCRWLEWRARSLEVASDSQGWPCRCEATICPRFVSHLDCSCCQHSKLWVFITTEQSNLVLFLIDLILSRK